MNLLEHQGKYLLAEAGLRVPRGETVATAAEAGEVAARLGGRVVCKAQVASGKRGKAGAVRVVDGRRRGQRVRGRACSARWSAARRCTS